MTEHFLDGAEVGSPFEKVGGEAVSEGVGRHFLAYSGCLGEVADDVEHHHPRHGMSAPVEEKDIGVARLDGSRYTLFQLFPDK